VWSWLETGDALGAPVPVTSLWMSSSCRPSSACQLTPYPGRWWLRFSRRATACTALRLGPSRGPCSRLRRGSSIAPPRGVRGPSKPAMARWGGGTGQLILIILHINNFQIVCKFGSRCQRSNVTLFLLPHSSECLSRSLVFLYLKLDCKWSGKGLGPPPPLLGPAGSCCDDNEQR